MSPTPQRLVFSLALLEDLVGAGRASMGLVRRCCRLPLAPRVAAFNGADPDESLGWPETGDPRLRRPSLR